MNTQDLIPSLARETTYDAWMEAALDLEQAAHTLDLEPWMVERLRQCESELHSNLLLQCDDGSAHIKRALNVSYTTVYPRRACELRISANAGLNSTRTAAMRTTLAAALFSLDISGAATTLMADPGQLSEHELRSLVDGYARLTAVSPEMANAETGDIVIAGEGVNDYVLAWLASANASRHISASDCSDAAAIALAHSIRRFHLQTGSAREATRVSRASLRFAIQGLGEFERAVARELVRKGGTLVAVSDISGGVIDKAGLDLGAVERHLQREEFILGYGDADATSSAELLTCGCDVLILAAGARHLNSGNGSAVRAALVVECAPNTVERESFVKCAEAPIVLPYLFTAGLRLAAVVQQHDANPLATPRRCQAELKLAALRVLKSLQACANEHDISLTEAAPLLALARLSRQLRLQGI